MLTLYIDKQLAEVKIFKFPAGESGVSFSVKKAIYTSGRINAMITLRWESNDDLINLALLADAVRREYDVDLALSIPYFPYARQDRVCNKGESLSVKVVADLINSLNFSRVYVMDPHSDVVGAVLNNVRFEDIVGSVTTAVCQFHRGNTVFVSPDAGANKKVLKLAGAFKVPVVRADKVRDTKTGSITGTAIYSEHLGDADVLVIDDILDNGGTFIPLAQELRKLTKGTVNLFVTHGMFNSGIDKFYGLYDNIFVANNMMKKEFKDSHGIMVAV